MSTQLTLNLSESLMRRAQAVANRAGRSVNDLLAESIELSLKPWSHSADVELRQCSDDDVIQACDLQMSATDDDRLSQLLSDQQSASLTAAEQAELTALMQVYQEGLVRKAEALSESVRRGLRGPVQP